MSPNLPDDLGTTTSNDPVEERAHRVGRCLHAAADADLYEQPLRNPDGMIWYPDFTIHTYDGRTNYWEHPGMLDGPTYAAAWERKENWYADQGIQPADLGGGSNGLLVAAARAATCSPTGSNPWP